MIRLQQLSKVYGRGADAVTVLDRLDFSVEWESLLQGSIVSEAVFHSP